jgi:hypothetical protein
MLPVVPSKEAHEANPHTLIQPDIQLGRIRAGDDRRLGCSCRARGPLSAADGSALAASTLAQDALGTRSFGPASGLLIQRQTPRFAPIAMEQLWNRGGATGGKRSTHRGPENRLNSRQTVATDCHRLPFGSHGKEGVSGSSPEEGSAKAPQGERVPAGRRLLGRRCPIHAFGATRGARHRGLCSSSRRTSYQYAGHSRFGDFSRSPPGIPAILDTVLGDQSRAPRAWAQVTHRTAPRSPAPRPRQSFSTDPGGAARSAGRPGSPGSGRAPAWPRGRSGSSRPPESARPAW